MHTPPGTDTHAPCRLCQARTALPLLPLEGEQDGAQHSTCREGQRALPWLQKSHAAGNFSTQAKITSRWALLNLLCRGGRGGAEQNKQAQSILETLGASAQLPWQGESVLPSSTQLLLRKESSRLEALLAHSTQEPTLCARMQHTVRTDVETTHPFDFNAQVLFDEVEIVVLQAVIKG